MAELFRAFMEVMHSYLLKLINVMKLVKDVFDAGTCYPLFDSLIKNWLFFPFLWAPNKNADNFFAGP